MKTEVYLDIYILVNASMDLLCLLLCARLCHAKTNRLRLVAAAAFGGGYAALCLLLGLSGFWSIATDLIAAALLTTIAFWGRNTSFLRLLRLIFVLFFLSAVLAGLLTLFYQGMNRLDLPLESLSGDGLSVWIFALVGGLSGLLTIRGGRFLGYVGKHREVDLILFFGEKEGRLHALVDSGNLVKDPLSGRGVIVAEKEKILPLLPEEMRRRLSKNDPAAWMGDGKDKIWLIPTQSATGERLLPALLPKKLLLEENGKICDADYLVALSDLGAKKRNFDALVPQE
ncbi:MAG: sigma-E processing peptidase SpoIIGA [Clostridia bacterium]|nr:sigma-E processing peptidase SpoIIGA [Clostridia bacterium]